MGNSEIALLAIVILFVVLTFIYAVTRANLEKERDESEAWGNSMYNDNEMLRCENQRLRAEVSSLQIQADRMKEFSTAISKEELEGYIVEAASYINLASENINAIVKKLDKEADN